MFKAFHDVIERGNNFLLIKLLSARHFNKDAFKQTLRKIWRLVKLVKFHEPSLGLILVKFDDVSDKEHVLSNGPWHFDKSLVLTKEYDMEPNKFDMSI